MDSPNWKSPGRSGGTGCDDEVVAEFGDVGLEQGFRLLLHPEDTGGVRALGGEGERHLVPGPGAVSARIGQAA